MMSSISMLVSAVTACINLYTRVGYNSLHSYEPSHNKPGILTPCNLTSEQLRNIILNPNADATKEGGRTKCYKTHGQEYAYELEVRSTIHRVLGLFDHANFDITTQCQSSELDSNKMPCRASVQKPPNHLSVCSKTSSLSRSTYYSLSPCQPSRELGASCTCT